MTVAATVQSHNGVLIRLTDERWQHIISRHIELVSERERVLETVATPQVILDGDFGELLSARFYSQTPLTQKYMIVAYREIDENDGYILTAYYTNRLSARRKVLWRQ